MKRFICLHGHFYQPPRENAWTGTIELQKSASPYHDWNERINAECYAPNAQTQILGAEKRPVRTINNYSYMSFNFGPTLLTWMEKHARETYEAILQADKDSQERFSGHGSAIAQVYNHMIMPLSNDHDKVTQVVWGICDFEYRFGRKPEGMWLAETAVNETSLEVLATHGIKYTILSPSQAKQIRAIGEERWTKIKEETLDTQIPYLCRLSDGLEIVIFFYNGQIANEIAFGKLLKNGEMFTNRIIDEYLSSQEEPRLVHIANDGETYGHHHEFGNVSLAYLINHVEKTNIGQMTNYGAFLEKNPPAFEVRIVNDSSWSCFHGVERWKSHCGCKTNKKKGWNQHWREHMRNALDWLRDRLIEHFETSLSGYFKDPWNLRNNYIHVLLNDSDKTRQSALWSHLIKPASDIEKGKIINLLEMQKFAMFMYTSCAWFFDDISGIESVQILQYACRANQLCRQTGGPDHEPEFLARLEAAQSNIPDYQNGRVIYERLVKPAEIASG